MNNLAESLQPLIGQLNLTESDVKEATDIVNTRWNRNFHSEVALVSAFFHRGEKDYELTEDEIKTATEFIVCTPERVGQCIKTLAHIKRYTFA